MEKYYRCNKCGQFVAKESSKPSICTSSALMPARRICGGAFSIEISEKEIIEQLKNWGYSSEQIDEFLVGE
jgi:hypothetical protein